MTATVNLPTYHLNDASVSARAAEVPAADFTGGLNRGGSNACGVGINTAAVNPKLSDWSLLDQHGDARSPQLSQHIGGNGLGVGSEDFTSLFAAQDPDFDDTLHFVVADQLAIPGGVYDTVSGAVNRTGGDIEIGDRAWGTVA